MQQEGEQPLNNIPTAVAKMQEGEEPLDNAAIVVVSTAAGDHPIPPPTAINTTKTEKSYHCISNRSHNVRISHGLTHKRKTPTSAAGRSKPIPGYQPLCNILHVQIGTNSEVIQDRMRLAHEPVRGATRYIAAAIEDEDEARTILLPWELEYSKKPRSSVVARKPRSGSRAGLQRLKLAAQGALPLAAEKKSHVGVATGRDDDDGGGDIVEEDVVRNRNTSKSGKKKTITAKKTPQVSRSGGGGWSRGGGNLQQQQQHQKQSWNHHRHLASPNDIDFNIEIDFDDDDFGYFDDMYDDEDHSTGKKRKNSNRNNNNGGSASKRVLPSNQQIPLPLSPPQLGHTYNYSNSSNSNHAAGLDRGMAPPPPPPPPSHNALMVGGFGHQSSAIVRPVATTTQWSPTQLQHQLQHQVPLVTLPKEQQQVIIQSLVVEMTQQERIDLQKLLPAQQVQILQNYYEERFLAQQQQQQQQQQPMIPLMAAIPGPLPTASAPINTNNNNNNNNISISGSPLLRPSASVGGLFEFGRLGAPSPGLDKVLLLDIHNGNNNADDEEKKRVLEEVADIF